MVSAAIKVIAKAQQNLLNVTLDIAKNFWKAFFILQEGLILSLKWVTCYHHAIKTSKSCVSDFKVLFCICTCWRCCPVHYSYM